MTKDEADGEESGAHHVMWGKQSNGTWKETMVAGMYRMFNDVQGEYVGISSDNPELQTTAFRDGNQLHIALNNLSENSQSVNIQALVGSATVNSATLDRVMWNGVEGVYFDDADVIGSWQTLLLTGEEGATLNLTLNESLDFESTVHETTYDGEDVQTPINLSRATSKVINIDADMLAAVSTTTRVAIAERSNIWNQTFDVVVNGNSIEVSPSGTNGFDEDNP